MWEEKAKAGKDAPVASGKATALALATEQMILLVWSIGARVRRLSGFDDVHSPFDFLT